MWQSNQLTDGRRNKGILGVGCLCLCLCLCIYIYTYVCICYTLQHLLYRFYTYFCSPVAGTISAVFVWLHWGRTVAWAGGRVWGGAGRRWTVLWRRWRVLWRWWRIARASRTVTWARRHCQCHWGFPYSEQLSTVAFSFHNTPENFQHFRKQLIQLLEYADSTVE